MSSVERTEPDIPGDYQHKALYEGPVSQRRWHRQKLVLLERHLPQEGGRRICDLGCGSGVVAHHVAQMRPEAEVVGVDINERSIAFAQENYGDRDNLRYLHQDVLETGLAELAPFDMVYSTEVIEHLRDEEVRAFLDTLRRLGGPGTRYLLTTPDYGTLWPVVEWSMDVLRLAPKLKGHQHFTLFKKRTLRALLEGAGFRVERLYNFCGVSTFAAHLSGRLGDRLERREWEKGKGMLIACEFTLAPAEDGA